MYSRQSFEDAQFFPAQRQHQGSQTVSSHLQTSPLSHQNPRNVVSLKCSQHRTTPEQAKIYVGNHFRANAQMTDLHDIDFKIDIGY